MSEDPIGFASGDTNLFRYVGNNPVYARDPEGLAASGVDMSEKWANLGYSLYGYKFNEDFTNQQTENRQKQAEQWRKYQEQLNEDYNKKGSKEFERQDPFTKRNSCQ